MCSLKSKPELAWSSTLTEDYNESWTFIADSIPGRYGSI